MKTVPQVRVVVRCASSMAACVALLAATACSGTPGTLPASSGDGGGGATTAPAGACVAVPASQLPAGASSATGSFSGAAAGNVCPGGVSARIDPAIGSGATAPYTFTLGYTMASAGSTGDFAFTSPAGATDGELTVTIGLLSAAAGQSASGATGACGTAAFTYALPVSPGLDCGKSEAPHCADGCTASCTDYGCDPCTPEHKSASFTARAIDDCAGDEQTASGSWTLTLTSVTAAESSGTLQTPHGSLTATLAAATGTTGTLDLNLTF